MLGRRVPVRARVTTPVRGAAAAGGAERGTGEDELEPVSGSAEGAGVVGAAGVRTPIPSHIDLAGNTSYHFAASRTVSHGCRLTMAGTVCAFWLTYMIVSLVSI